MESQDAYPIGNRDNAYSAEEIMEATNQLESKLGEGLEGTVYKGILRDGTEVAIKAVGAVAEDLAAFETEVRVGCNWRHPNLCILMGYAVQERQCYLVYEYLSGGDVAARLASASKFAFTGEQRLQVLLDTALALSYLMNSKPRVYHRDIKTPNILLDKHGAAKLGDFGLSCLSKLSASMQVKNTAGTLGYADPEYVRTSVVTEYSEIYSWGMVALELLTGSPPAVQTRAGVEYLMFRIHNPSSILAMLDPYANWSPTIANSLADLVLRCSGAPSQRPNFIEIVKQLRYIQQQSLTQAPPYPPHTRQDCDQYGGARYIDKCGRNQSTGYPVHESYGANHEDRKYVGSLNRSNMPHCQPVELEPEYVSLDHSYPGHPCDPPYREFTCYPLDKQGHRVCRSNTQCHKRQPSDTKLFDEGGHVAFSQPQLCPTVECMRSKTFLHDLHHTPTPQGHSWTDARDPGKSSESRRVDLRLDGARQADPNAKLHNATAFNGVPKHNEELAWVGTSKSSCHHPLDSTAASCNMVATHGIQRGGYAQEGDAELRCQRSTISRPVLSVSKPDHSSLDGRTCPNVEDRQDTSCALPFVRASVVVDEFSRTEWLPSENNHYDTNMAYFACTATNTSHWCARPMAVEPSYANSGPHSQMMHRGAFVDKHRFEGEPPRQAPVVVSQSMKTSYAYVEQSQESRSIRRAQTSHNRRCDGEFPHHATMESSQLHPAAIRHNVTAPHGLWTTMPHGLSRHHNVLEPQWHGTTMSPCDQFGWHHNVSSSDSESE